MGKLGTLFLVTLLVSASVGMGYGIWRQSAPLSAATHHEQQGTVTQVTHLPDYVQTMQRLRHLDCRLAIGGHGPAMTCARMHQIAEDWLRLH